MQRTAVHWERRRLAGKVFGINAAVIFQSCRRDAGAPSKWLQSEKPSWASLHRNVPPAFLSEPGEVIFPGLALHRRRSAEAFPHA
jgi:hypothetical protein